MKKWKIIVLGCIVGLFVIFAATQAMSLAKYTSNAVLDYYLESKGFYFSSPDFSDTTIYNNNWNGGSTKFTLVNSKNDSLISGYDINYTVSCSIKGDASSKVKCKLNGEDSSTYNGVLSSYYGCKNTKDDTDVSNYDKDTCENGGYEWSSSATNKEIYFDIESLTGEEVAGLTVEINVTSTSPYKKVLTQEYVLNKGISETGSFNMKYTALNYNDKLVVTNSYNEDKCAKLSWDSNKVTIDISKEDVSSIGTDSKGFINSIVFNISKKDSINFIFYKVNKADNITENLFTLIESNEC